MSTSLSTPSLVTADQLFVMAADEGHYELVEGELQQMAPSGFEHGKVSIRSGARLLAFADLTRLGTVVGAETGFLIQRNPDTVLAPDAAFIKSERIRAIGLPKKGYFPEAPALVVEVVSPNDTVDEVDEKMRRWMSAGAELGWVLQPHSRTVTVYRALDDIRVFTENDTLDGEPVLPGFSCRVSELFVP